MVTSQVAYACLNAVAGIAAQVAATETRSDDPDTEVVADLHPEALRQTVGALREAVLPAGFAGLEPDLYARTEAVHIPGLRGGRGGKRAAVHATSYHAAVIKLACALYHRLAEEALTYWTAEDTPGRIDPREWFDDDGSFEYAAVPVYRDFSTTRWPKRLGETVVEQALAAAPTVNVGRLQAELELEIRRADEQHLTRVRRQATDTGDALVSAAEALERQYTAAIASYGTGHTLTVGVYPFDAMPPAAERLIFTRVSIPPAGRPELPARLDVLGHADLADHQGSRHGLLYVLFSDDTPAGRQVAEVFLGLSRQAGAFCFRVPDLTAAGPASRPDLVWLNTLYAYLKGTDAVEDRAGHSRIRYPFAASVRLLGQMLRGDQTGANPPWYGSLRPGLPSSTLNGLVIDARLPTPDDPAPGNDSTHDARTVDEPDSPAARNRTPKSPPAVYVAIRNLYHAHKMTAAAIVRHLRTSDGQQVRELVDADLKRQPRTVKGRKRTAKDVVRAALRDQYNPRPDK